MAHLRRYCTEEVNVDVEERERERERKKERKRECESYERVMEVSE